MRNYKKYMDGVEVSPELHERDVYKRQNRAYGRADYLPCIAWGSLAACCGRMSVGDRLRLEGRLQSRQYRKVVDGEAVSYTHLDVYKRQARDSSRRMSPGHFVFIMRIQQSTVILSVPWASNSSM